MLFQISDFWGYFGCFFEFRCWQIEAWLIAASNPISNVKIRVENGVWTSLSQLKSGTMRGWI